MKRERIVFTGILVGIALVLGYGWLRILRAGPVRGHWQSAKLAMALAGPSPELALAPLNERAARATAASDFRNGGKLVFWRDGKVARAQVTLDGDDWDLAALLRAAMRLAREAPSSSLEIVSEPPGERFVASASGFGKREAAVQRFLLGYAGPRPNLEGAYNSLVLDAPLDATKMRAGVETELAGKPLPHLVGSIAYEARAGGVRITARTDGDVRTLVTLLAALQTALDRVSNSVSERPVQLVLDGKQHRALTLGTFDDWFALRDELRTGAGPL